MQSNRGSAILCIVDPAWEHYKDKDNKGQKTMKETTKETVKEVIGIAILLGLFAFFVKVWFVMEGFEIRW